MPEPYIGEIQAFAFASGNEGFRQGAWLPCNGQLVQISTNQPLFAVLGLRYGGDGITTFGLPNLNGRAAIGQGQGPGLTDRILAQQVGTPTVSLDVSMMPSHTHGLQLGTDPSGAGGPGPGANNSSALLNPNIPGFAAELDANRTYLSTTTVVDTGQGAPHENMQPYLSLAWYISTEGIYPNFAEDKPA